MMCSVVGAGEPADAGWCQSTGVPHGAVPLRLSLLQQRLCVALPRQTATIHADVPLLPRSVLLIITCQFSTICNSFGLVDIVLWIAVCFCFSQTTTLTFLTEHSTHSSLLGDWPASSLWQMLRSSFQSFFICQNFSQILKVSRVWFSLFTRTV